MREANINGFETREELPVNRYYIKLLTKEMLFFRRTLKEKNELKSEEVYTFRSNLKILSALARKYRSMFRAEPAKAN